MTKQEKLNKLYEEYQADPAFAHMIHNDVQFVPGFGDLNPAAMLIGEAPGSVENREGQPFVGKAGKKLDTILKGVGVKKDDIYLTNVVKFWPLNENHKTRTPTDDEIAASREYIKREIEIIKPVYVGLLGRSSTTALYPNVQTIKGIAGKLYDGMYIPLYHPAYALYKPEREETDVTPGYMVLAALINSLE